MLPQSDVRFSGPELTSSVPNSCRDIDLALGALSIVSNPFRFYHYYVNGISAEELASVFDLPVSWIQQRIEAVRLCVEHQIVFTLDPGPDHSVNEDSTSPLINSQLPVLRTSAP
jgi:hypothetical protein